MNSFAESLGKFEKIGHGGGAVQGAVLISSKQSLMGKSGRKSENKMEHGI